MLGLGSIVSVNSSITLMHPLRTEIITIEICLAKFSNPFWLFEPCTLLNSSKRFLFLVISTTF
jgi:hypothetical protein